MMVRNRISTKPTGEGLRLHLKITQSIYIYILSPEHGLMGVDYDNCVMYAPRPLQLLEIVMFFLL